MSDAKPVLEERFCKACGAEQPYESKECWLCGSKGFASSRDGTGPQKSIRRVSRPQRMEENYSLATTLLALALVATVVGLFFASPYFGMPAAIGAAIAFGLALYQGDSRPDNKLRALREAVGGLFLGIIVAVGLFGILAAAAFVGFFIVCLKGVSVGP